jgi:K(+)-stimulated pyrophosphate-energized sodium pump
MNLVSLLIAAAVVKMTYGGNANTPLRLAIAIVAALIIVVAVYISKRRPIAIGDSVTEQAPATPSATV